MDFTNAIRCLVALSLLVLASPTHADEQKIIRLEQDVRDLERMVRDQARQIEDLRRQLGHPPTPPPRATPQALENPSTQWLAIKNWDRVRIGMSELEVIEALGPPTSMRTGAAGSRTLFYAMELGPGNFLGGSIALRDRKVSDVQRPELR